MWAIYHQLRFFRKHSARKLLILKSLEAALVIADDEDRNDWYLFLIVQRCIKAFEESGHIGNELYGNLCNIEGAVERGDVALNFSGYKSRSLCKVFSLRSAYQRPARSLAELKRGNHTSSFFNQYLLIDSDFLNEKDVIKYYGHALSYQGECESKAGDKDACLDLCVNDSAFSKKTTEEDYVSYTGWTSYECLAFTIKVWMDCLHAIQNNIYDVMKYVDTDDNKMLEDALLSEICIAHRTYDLSTAIHCAFDTFYYNEKHHLSNSNLLKMVYGHAKGVYHAIAELAIGDEFVIPTGWSQHAVYVSFQKLSYSKVLIRIDNFGEGVSFGDHLQHAKMGAVEIAISSDTKESVSAYFPVFKCSEMNENLLNYIHDLILLKVKNEEKGVGYETIYRRYAGSFTDVSVSDVDSSMGVLSLDALKQRTSVVGIREQLVGNCALYNFMAGAAQRMGKDLYHKTALMRSVLAAYYHNKPIDQAIKRREDLNKDQVCGVANFVC